MDILSTFTTTQRFKSFRKNDLSAAAVFVNGFGASPSTWDEMAYILATDASVSGWDILGLGYATSKLIDVLPGWSIDPGLDDLSHNLRTALSLPPFDRYAALALIGHSLGGLIIQRALVDDLQLRERVQHVAMFGTPSAGSSSPLAFYKKQTRDTLPGSKFIKKLRRDWSAQFQYKTPFTLTVVSGSKDDFVRNNSALEPFPKATQKVVDGNHISMVHPRDMNDQSVRLVVKLLSGKETRQTVIDGARLAVERGEFRRVVAALAPKASTLDGGALCDLALALEELGESDQALAILEDHYGTGTTSSDAKGILAGRIKRRWLLERNVSDHMRAVALYREALGESQTKVNNDQVFYHAINVAFLFLLITPKNSKRPEEVERYVNIALKSCCSDLPSQWELATRAEAALLLGSFGEALRNYELAVGACSSPRECSSMFSQAAHICQHSFSAHEERQLAKLFWA